MTERHKTIFSRLGQAFLFILLLSGVVFSQQFSVKTYTVMDGLPSSNMNSIAQDKYGRMWFATRNGVSVYDGITWKNYSKKDGLYTNEFRAVYSDNKGNVWAAAQLASYVFIRFEEEGFKLSVSVELKNLRPDVTFNKCFGVYINDKDTVALMGSGNEGLVAKKNNKWFKITSRQGLPSDKIRDIKEWNGSFYVLTDKGICIVGQDLSVKFFWGNLPQMELNKLWSLYIDPETKIGHPKIWLLGENAIGYLDGDKFVKKVDNIKLGELSSTDYPRFFPDFHGFYFYGTQRNLFVFDEETKKTIYLSDQKNSVFTGINNVMRDREDNLWILSNRGVYKIRTPKFNTMNSQSGLLKDEVTAVSELGNSMVFGHEEGITFLTNGKFEKVKISDKKVYPADYRVMEFAKDKDGNIWMAAAKRGLGLIDSKHTIKWFSLPKENSLSVLSVAADKNGSIYACTYNNVYKFDNGKFVPIDISSLMLRENIRRIGFTDKNELVICTMSVGVFVRSESGVFKNYQSKGIFNANNVYSTFALGDTLLVGSLNGIYYLSGDSLAKYNKIKVDRPVYFIGKDNENYWIGTDFGVVRWHRGVQIVLTPHENLAGLETNRGGFFKNSKGVIWIGTDKGVSQYLKPKAPDKIPIPELKVNYFGGGNKAYTLNDNIEQGYQQNQLTFEINVYSYVNENQNSYTAYLENFDTNWLPEIRSTEKLRYTNLPPGNYRLHVKGKNALGRLSTEYISPQITILPPFYRRWWFILFLIAAAIGIIYIIVLFLQRKRYAAHLEKEVLTRTSALQDSELKYRNLVNNIFEGVAVVQNSRVQFMNPAMAAMVGYNIEDVIGKEWNNFAHPDDIARLYEIHKLRLNGVYADPQVELRLKHSSGKILTVVANTSVINYEGAPAVFTTIRDVTEQKAREAELVKLFAAVQQSSSAIMITDPAGIIEYINPVFETISGYGRDEVLGVKTSIIKSGKMDLAVYEELWRTIGSGLIWRGELLNSRKNGELYWVRASISPIKDPEGKITNYIAVEDDITFEKYARQEIEKTERLLNAILNKVPVIIFTLDNQNNISFIKGNGLGLLGSKGPEEIAGRHLKELFSMDENLQEDLNRIALKNQFTSQHFAGDYVFEVHYTPVSGGFENNVAVIGLAINITDYYNAEKTIKESEAKIKALLNAIPDYIFEVNKDKTILTYHEPKEAGIKYPYGEIPGRNIQSAFPNIWPEIESVLNRVFEEREDQMAVFRFTAYDEERYFEARFVLKDEDTALAIVRNVTEKAIAEQEIIKAKEEAEKSDRLKSEFLAHMSHEIRTPVNTIMNFTSLMEEELQNKLSDDLADGFRVIRDGGFRLIRTIDLILNMSQIQTGTYSPFYKKIDINGEVLRSIIQEFHYRAKRKGLELTYTVEALNTSIYGDDYTIGQIFANLIDNALKYTNNGKIDVLLKNDGTSVIVEVADTGIGISSEYLPKLFSPFTQEEMGYTRRFDGTGLGLALVRNYVDINKAEISVESEKDKGTKFIVKFPLTEING